MCEPLFTKLFSIYSRSSNHSISSDGDSDDLPSDSSSSSSSFSLINSLNDASQGLVPPAWINSNEEWKVDCTGLKLATNYYLATHDRSTCIATHTADVNAVAKKIMTCLKAHSIQVKYTSNQIMDCSDDNAGGRKGNIRIVAPPKANCVTMDMVEFQVRLYIVNDSSCFDHLNLHSRSTTKESKASSSTAAASVLESSQGMDVNVKVDQCLVEVRRMAGCPVAFTEYRQLLAHAVNPTKESVVSSPPMLEKLPPVAPLYDDVTTHTATSVADSQSEEDLVDKALTRVMRLLQDPVCGTYLGIKYLTFLSECDNDITRPHFPRRLARRVMTESSDSGSHDIDTSKAGHIRNLVESLLRESAFLNSSKIAVEDWQHSFTVDSDSISNNLPATTALNVMEKLDEGEEEDGMLLLSVTSTQSNHRVKTKSTSTSRKSNTDFHFRETRYMSIMLLTNMIMRFQSCSSSSYGYNDDGSDETFQKEIERVTKPWLLHRVFPLLILELSEAEDRPHEAYAASKCLAAIMSSLPEVTTLTDHENLLHALQKANCVGEKSHPCLAQNTHKILTLLHV